MVSKHKKQKEIEEGVKKKKKLWRGGRPNLLPVQFHMVFKYADMYYYSMMNVESSF